MKKKEVTMSSKCNKFLLDGFLNGSIVFLLKHNIRQKQYSHFSHGSNVPLSITFIVAHCNLGSGVGDGK